MRDEFSKYSLLPRNWKEVGEPGLREVGTFDHGCGNRQETDDKALSLGNVAKPTTNVSVEIKPVRGMKERMRVARSLADKRIGSDAGEGIRDSATSCKHGAYPSKNVVGSTGTCAASNTR